MRDRGVERARLAAALATAALDAERGRPDQRLDVEHLDDVAMALYFAGELEPEAVEAFERHVAACAGCASDVATAAQIESAARIESAALDATAARAARVEAAPEGGDATAPPRRDTGRSTATRDTGRSPSRTPRFAPARLRRRLRRLALAAGIVLVATAGLLAVGGRMALTRLQPVLLGELSRALERGVSGERLAFAFGGGPGIAIEGLRVEDDDRFSQASFLETGRTVLAMDVAALMRGELDGSIAVHDAVVRLVRGPAGAWNVQTLGDRSGGRGPAGSRPVAPAVPGERKRVQLTSVTVRNGRLEIADRSGATARELVLRDLALDVRRPDAEGLARVELDGVVGSPTDARKVAISGKVGPFTRGTAPRWQLTDVSLDRIPLADVPGAPAAVRGELTFSGRLESSGDAVDAVVANARGSGDLGLCCGSLAAGNLGRDVVAALGNDLADRAAATAFAGAVAAAAAREPGVATALAAPETAFRNAGGRVDLTADALTFRNLTLATSLFTAESAGTLSRGGAVAVSGSLALEPEFAAVVAQAASALRPLVGADGRLSVPFRATGTWPRIAVAVDLSHAVAAARHLDPRALCFSLGPGSPFVASNRGSLPGRIAG